MTHPLLSNILYAEDEMDIRAIAQVALEDIGGFHVKYCASGREVFEAVKTYRPDLFLLDVMMPEIDGPTLLKELYKIPKLKLVPAIFMTAKIQPDEIKDYKKLGVIDVIAKPFDPMTLADLIKQSWDNYYDK